MAADAVAEAGDILDKLKIDEKKEETMSDSKGDASSQKKGKSAGRRFFRSFRVKFPLAMLKNGCFSWSDAPTRNV